MTTFKAISGLEVLREWLLPLGIPAGAVKPPGVTPYRMINRVAGTDDKITDTGTYSIHDFALNFEAAEANSELTRSRMMDLGPPLAPQQRVTISGGRIVCADHVSTDQAPFFLKYNDDPQLWRFVARYRVDFRLVAV
jgi:hypothetical protein